MVEMCGKVVPLVMYGPPSPAKWATGDRVFRSVCVRWVATTIEVLELDRYDKLYYANKSSTRRWGLIYQTDVRTRTRHARRLRMGLAVERTEVRRITTTTPYDPSRPWDKVYNHLIHH